MSSEILDHCAFLKSFQTFSSKGSLAPMLLMSFFGSLWDFKAFAVFESYRFYESCVFWNIFNRFDILCAFQSLDSPFTIFFKYLSLRQCWNCSLRGSRPSYSFTLYFSSFQLGIHFITSGVTFHSENPHNNGPFELKKLCKKSRPLCI